MPNASVDPSTGRSIQAYANWDDQRVAQALEAAHSAQRAWARTDMTNRAAVLLRVASTLRAQGEEHAALITREMGKLLREARAEVEKCATVCDYYAQHGEEFMRAEPVETEVGRAYVAYQPLGVVFAIMPWNFPYWQVFRAAIPALMAGNALVLKHASNVPGCALAIEGVFREAGLPEGLFTALMMEVRQAADVIASAHVHGVTLTGSEAAGRKVAAHAGQQLKKCVLELGGSDAFVVLHDADMEHMLDMAMTSRFQNCGQSCIAAKRFIVVPQIAEQFVGQLRQRVEALKTGAPMDDATQLGPMARADLRDALHRQIADSIAQGAVAVTGCKPVEGQGYYYQPSILDHVTPASRAWHEELFGPVAAVIRAADEENAVRIANDTRYGLGASVWSRDAVGAEKLAARIEAGRPSSTGWSGPTRACLSAGLRIQATGASCPGRGCTSS